METARHGHHRHVRDGPEDQRSAVTLDGRNRKMRDLGIGDLGFDTDLPLEITKPRPQDNADAGG